MRGCIKLNNILHSFTSWEPRVLNSYGRTLVKICCIESLEGAWLAISHGASALGLVSEMPSGPGIIPEELIREIATNIPPYITSVLLTSHQDAVEIIEQHRRCKTNAIQLVDSLESGSYDELRKAMPGIGLIQVVHVSGEKSIQEAKKVARFVDAVHLDSGNQYAVVKELGGTGRIHDWSLSKKIRNSINKPLILAGGLSHENVAEAIKQVEPFAVDVCSGVRTDGRLDETKLSAFMAEVSNL